MNFGIGQDGLECTTYVYGTHGAFYENRMGTRIIYYYLGGHCEQNGSGNNIVVTSKWECTVE